LSNTAHITIFQVNGEQIDNWQMIKKDLENVENVRKISPTSYENALIVSKTVTSYCVLRVKSQESRVENQKIQIAIGAELAEKMNLKIGDETEIILPTLQSQFAPKTSQVIVRDIFHTGLYDYDSTWIYLSLEDLANISQRPNFAPSVLSVSVKDIYSANKTATKLREILPNNFKILDWQEANRPLFAALSLEKKVALAIISLIIFIAALNITTTLALLVNERRLDIAILSTCGAQTRNILTIFLLEGLFLGVVGIIFGVILGLTVCVVGNYFKIISLPTEVYSLNYVPLTPNMSDVLLIILITFLLILIATVYPARKAAKIKPLENLRNQ
jgi:lipoprotein-releasing system permease protein